MNNHKICSKTKQKSQITMVRWMIKDNLMEKVKCHSMTEAIMMGNLTTDKCKDKENSHKKME